MEKQTNPQPTKQAQGSKIIWAIIISAIVIALIVGSSIYLWQHSNLKSTKQKLQQQITTLENQVKQLQQTNESTFQSTNQANNTNTTVTNSNMNETETASSLTSLDQTWELYTNNKYGFSIKVPKKMYHGYGSMCKWENDSYRPKGSLVPAKIFENGNVYISSEYFYNLSGETIKNNIHYYSECKKVTNTLSHLEDNTYFQQQSWKFIVKNVSNDSELETFIKERYGNGCKLGNKNASIQEGVYDVSVQGDGKDLGETECPLNYITVLKYYPAKNKAISWNLGQSSTFAADENYQTIYDQEMVDSFRFK